MQDQERRRRFGLWLSITIGACAMVAIAASYGTAPSAKPSMVKATHPPQVRDAYGHLPLSFEENRGQTDPQVKFLARGGGYSLFLTPTEAVLKLRAPSSAKKQSRPGAMPIAFHPESIEKPKFSVVRIRLDGANPNSTASGVDALPGHSNYFIGKDRAKWRTGIATYGGVRFESIYPGINLVYRGTQGRLEYDFVIAPKADPSRIKMNIEGADALSLDGDRNLVIKTASGEVIQKAPVIYQESHGAKHPISGGYALMGKHSVMFKLGAYDRSAPLIIDPLLTYVSYLGGGGEFAYSIAVDSSGSALVTGLTSSSEFPVTANPLQADYFGNDDAFITKVSPDGTRLIYSTYAGGSETDFANSIAVDPSGNAYLTGYTTSQDYPVSVGAFQTVPGEGFVTTLDPSGGLIYSTYIDGEGASIAANAAGEASITGFAYPSFTTTANAFQNSCPTSESCTFLAQLNSDGTALNFATLFGPSSVGPLAEDSSGDIYIAGMLPPGGVPPFSNGACTITQPTPTNCAYIAKLDSSGTDLIFVQIIPRSAIQSSAQGLVVDGSGNSHLLFGHDFGVGQVSAIANLSADGANLAVTSYSQAGSVSPQSIAVDLLGNLFIGGRVLAGQAPPPFVTTPGAFQTNYGGGSQDGYIQELDPTGSFTLYATLIGGSGNDGVTSLAVDLSGNVYATGTTDSTDFPVTKGVFQPNLAGVGGNAFVARIIPVPKLSPTPTVTVTATPTSTQTATATSTAVLTVTATAPRTPIPTRVPVPTSTAPTTTATSTPAITPTATPTPTPTATPIGPVIYSPDALKFPTRRVDTVSGLKFVTVSNPKKNKTAITITGVTPLLESPPVLCFVSGGGPPCGFGIDATRTTCVAGLSVAAGKSCRVAILFSPIEKGAWTGLLQISGNMTNPGSITLTGVGR